MKSFVITIPIDENVECCIHELAYRLYIKSQIVSNALVENDPDTLFEVFDNMGDRDLGIEYSVGLEITADKIEDWDDPEFEKITLPSIGEDQPIVLSNSRELAEISLSYAPQDFVAPVFAPKDDAGFDIPQLEVMG